METNEIPDMILTTSEAAAKLGVSEKTLRDWDKNGKLVPLTVTMGGHRRYRLSDLMKVLPQESFWSYVDANDVEKNYHNNKKQLEDNLDFAISQGWVEEPKDDRTAYDTLVLARLLHNFYGYADSGQDKTKEQKEFLAAVIRSMWNSLKSKPFLSIQPSAAPCSLAFHAVPSCADGEVSYRYYEEPIIARTKTFSYSLPPRINPMKYVDLLGSAFAVELDWENADVLRRAAIEVDKLELTDDDDFILVGKMEAELLNNYCDIDLGPKWETANGFEMIGNIRQSGCRCITVHAFPFSGVIIGKCPTTLMHRVTWAPYHLLLNFATDGMGSIRFCHRDGYKANENVGWNLRKFNLGDSVSCK